MPNLETAVGDNHKVASAMLIDFGLIGKKTDIGRARRRETAVFSSAQAEADGNIGLMVHQRAAEYTATVKS